MSRKSRVCGKLSVWQIERVWEISCVWEMKSVGEMERVCQPCDV